MIISSVATGSVGGASVARLGLNCAAAGCMGTLATATATAISSVSAQVVTQLTIGVLAQQSPGEIMVQILSTHPLKNIVPSAVSAGALHEVGGLKTQQVRAKR